MESVISQIRKELKNNADEKIRESGKRFFKEPVQMYGVNTALTGNIAREYFKLVKTNAKQEIFDLCETFWQSGYMEESFIACKWSWFLRAKYEPGDFKLFESWVTRYISNWAVCDTFCNHTVGEFIERYPEFLGQLKTWANSENRWVRRGAAVSLIVPARKGKIRDAVFDIADALLTDSDDMVQKGYGWLLKVASQHHQQEVFEYVLRNKNIMPRTALRYAIEKMPEEMRREAMKKALKNTLGQAQEG
jgi:3-methyladenine DNA glycosylase AlkD